MSRSPARCRSSASSGASPACAARSCSCSAPAAGPARRAVAHIPQREVPEFRRAISGQVVGTRSWRCVARSWQSEVRFNRRSGIQGFNGGLIGTLTGIEGGRARAVGHRRSSAHGAVHRMQHPGLEERIPRHLLLLLTPDRRQNDCCGNVRWRCLSSGRGSNDQPSTRCLHCGWAVRRRHVGSGRRGSIEPRIRRRRCRCSGGGMGGPLSQRTARRAGRRLTAGGLGF